MLHYPSGQKLIRFQQNNIGTMACYNVIYLTFKLCPLWLYNFEQCTQSILQPKNYSKYLYSPQIFFKPKKEKEIESVATQLFHYLNNYFGYKHWQ